MRIGLDATCFNDRPSGARQRFVGIYGELIKRLPDAEFIVYEPVDCRAGSWFDGASNVSVRHTPLPSEGRVKKFFGGLGYWGSALQSEGFDVFEGFNLPLVKAPSGQTLLTIHDIRRLHPRYDALERVVYKAVLERALKTADHVITVSQAMKQEILSFYPNTRITVIYNGLNVEACDPVAESELLAVRTRFELPEEFIVAVGHLEGRKNYLRLVDSIALLRDRGRACSLLIVGNDSGEKKAIEERVESANLSGRIKILSGLGDLELRCVYRLSSLFVFPSTYEGFGIPILEAMAAGLPMVLSDIPVFREITQDTGVYFPHDDVESMAFAIEKVLYSRSESDRLVEYGSKRVQDFTFQSLSAQVENLYRSIL